MNISLNRHSQTGFSLLEVLIAIVVVSIGLLTVAALQVVTKKANYEAVQRTTASLLAHDMTERMRANRGALDSYLVSTASPLGDGSRTGAPLCNSLANACSPDEIALFDLQGWEQAMDGAAEVAVIATVSTQTGGLVSPSACITRTGAGGSDMYTIAIAWRGTTALTDPALVNPTTTSTCGRGSGKYGDNDEYRRVLSYEVFLS